MKVSLLTTKKVVIFAKMTSLPRCRDAGDVVCIPGGVGKQDPGGPWFRAHYRSVKINFQSRVQLKNSISLYSLGNAIK